MFSTGDKTVDVCGTMNFEGNIIPHTWAGQFTFKNGNPDYLSMWVLADIVYWHRPTIIRDEQTGMIVQVKKKFKADLLQKNYADLEKQFAASKKAMRDALGRLEDMGLIKRHFRHTPTASNVMYIELFVTRLAEITYPQLLEHTEKETELPEESNDDASCPTGNDDLTPQGMTILPHREGPSCPTGNDDHAPQGNTYTKNTKQRLLTKITPKNKKNDNHVDDGKIPYQEIIAHLNEKTGKQFNHQAKAHREKIRGRFEDGFTKEDFIRVIDNKVRQWKYHPKMKQYLRPGTLFSQEKFDNYLNEGGENEVNPGSDLDEYDFSKMEWDDSEE